MISNTQTSQGKNNSIFLQGELDEIVAGYEEPEVQIIGFKDDFFLFNDPSQLSGGASLNDIVLTVPR